MTTFIDSSTTLFSYTLASSIILVSALLLGTYVFTTIRYYWALKRDSASQNQKLQSPTQIPYFVPWLGNTLAFLAPKPGLFWSQLFRWHPRNSGACTIVLGGRPTHILYNPVAIQHLFKARGPTREHFNNDVVIKGFGIWPASELQTYYGYNEPADETGMTPGQQLERINHEYLLKTESVNELTTHFIRFFRDRLDNEFTKKPNEQAREVNLYAWLRHRMFNASTEAFFGKRILEMYPDLEQDFYIFDRYVLHMFFGYPRFIVPQAYAVREKLLEGMSKWTEDAYERCKGKIASPDGDVAWEPLYGSRAIRAHHTYYHKRGCMVRTMAGLSLGMMFGISSNAIPATGWMLMHILNPAAAGGDPTLYPRIMEEVTKSQKADGSIDIPTLVNQPLLLSTLHEVLRLYTDVLVSRTLPQDIELPLSESVNGKNKGGSLLLKQRSIVMAPNWLGQRDETLWTGAPCDTFFAERFLSPSDPNDQNSKPIFSTNGTAGKLFPFGGGKTMCPGRVFAKQEVLGSVAALLLEFDFEVLGFVDQNGKARSLDKASFPGLRDSFQGSGIMVMDGDLKVKITRKGE